MFAGLLGVKAVQPLPYSTNANLRNWSFSVVVVLAVCLARAEFSVAQDKPPCGAVTSEELLKCAGGLTDEAKMSRRVSDTLAQALESLAAADSYDGASSDLARLKEWSRELKDRDPLSNRDIIAQLDSAIASYKDEIRSAVSIQAAANEAIEKDKLVPGTNIQSIFVRRKLAFLDSDRAEFYKGGPFDAVRQDLLASALEESFFLDGKNADKDKLRREVKIIDSLLALYDAPPGYLYFKQLNLEKNSHLFWRASLLFVLGSRSDATEALRKIVKSNSNFDIESKDAGDVYIYRVFNLPYEIRLLSAKDGRQANFEINDPSLVERYFNPGQIALAACVQLDRAGSLEGIYKFRDAISSQYFHDYYVVAGSASDEKKLQRFESALQEAVGREELRSQLQSLTQSVLDRESSFANTMETGAKACDIDDATRLKIYSPFQFSSLIKAHTEANGQHRARLLIGGRLAADQAQAVADFLKKILDTPALRSLGEQLGINTGVYFARATVNQ
jgi:hypothetical protein